MARRLICLAVAMLTMVACSHIPDPPKTSTGPSSPTAAPRSNGLDPQPLLPPDGQTLDSAGGAVDQDGVRIVVPSSAVPAGHAITVKIGSDVGHVEGPFTSELAGHPASVDHDEPLRSALTVSWRLPQLTEEQRASIVLARWDPPSQAWKASAVKRRWSGDTLSADIRHFSVWDWFADVGQAVGSVTGSRVDAPTCDGSKLPDWVRQTVDPDEDVSAAAIRVCFEKDKDERVTVRVANNRPFSQLMTMTEGDQKWAWTYPGQGHGLADIAIYPSAHDVLDSDTRFLLPPLSTQAVGVARPAESGSHLITAQATVDWRSVLVDVSAYEVGQLPVGGYDNPLLNAFLQVLFECGGKAAADVDSPKDLVAAVVETSIGCSTEILNPDSDFGAEFAELSLKLAKKSGMSVGKLVQADRVVRELASGFRALEVGKLAFYASDQFANSLVKPLSWSIRGNGTAPSLGDWTPTCASYSEDSRQLYRNIALQDDFADHSKELWQFKKLPNAARQAVEPLQSCSTSYRYSLAQYLPSDWADAKAAQVVANIMLAGLPARTDAKIYLGRCYSVGEKLQTSPSSYVFGCDGTSSLDHMTWSHWTTDDAVGTGTATFASCQPSCAASPRYTVPVEVHLFQPHSLPNCRPDIQWWSLLTIVYVGQLPPEGVGKPDGSYHGHPSVTYPDEPSFDC